MIKRIAACLSVLVMAMAFCASPARTGSAQAANDVHHWVLLLDVSASFNDRRRGSGDRYSLRSEAMQLVQTLIAIAGEASPAGRHDDLMVYVFGKDTRAVRNGALQPEGWHAIHHEGWWQRTIDGTVGGDSNYVQFTELFDALLEVKAYFDPLPAGDHKHLILISDGELDTAPTIRRTGTPCESEELKEYRRYLKPDSPLIRALNVKNLHFDALTVDRNRDGIGDEDRQSAIRRILNGFDGGTTAEKALHILDRNPNGPKSEGPYIMVALADLLNGHSRSVDERNLLDVLWKVIVPDGIQRQFMPPRTKRVIITAPRDARVSFRRETDRRPIQMRLDDHGRIEISPPEVRSGLNITHHASTHHVTWVVDSTGSAPIVKTDERFPSVPLPNLMRIWSESAPPQQADLGTDVPLVLQVVYTGNSPKEDLATWRDYFRSHRNAIEAIATVGLPDGRDEAVRLNPVEGPVSGNVVLELKGVFAQATRPGNYRLSAQVTVGDRKGIWTMVAPPTAFQVVMPPPEIMVRPVADGKVGEAVQVLPKSASTPRPILHFPYGATAEVIFESPSRPGAPLAEGPFTLVIPWLKKPLPASGNDGTAWRSAPLRVPDAVLGRELAIEMTGNGITRQGSLRLDRERSPEMRLAARAKMHKGLGDPVVIYPLGERPPVLRLPNKGPRQFVVEMWTSNRSIPPGDDTEIEIKDFLPVLTLAKGEVKPLEGVPETLDWWVVWRSPDLPFTGEERKTVDVRATPFGTSIVGRVDVSIAEMTLGEWFGYSLHIIKYFFEEIGNYIVNIYAFMVLIFAITIGLY